MDSQGCGMTCAHAHLGRMTSKRWSGAAHISASGDDECDRRATKRLLTAMGIVCNAHAPHSGSCHGTPRALMCTGRKMKRVCKSRKSG